MAHCNYPLPTSNVLPVKRLDFSTHWFTTENLTKAAHTCDLTAEEFITLNLDYKQHGLGSESCGPGVLPQYQLKADPFGFTLRLRGIDTRVTDSAHAARRRWGWL